MSTDTHVPPDIPSGSSPPDPHETVSAADARFETARRLVAEQRKASPAWLQRQLGVGYNAALGYIERMEREGWVTAPDHVGRRDILKGI